MEFILLVLLILVFAFGGWFLAIVRGLSAWNRNYQRLGTRYGGKRTTGGVFYGYGLTNPSLMFDYGRTFCVLKNRKSFRFDQRRQTELNLNWPDKKIRLEISNAPFSSHGWGSRGMKQVEIDNPQFQANFFVASNQPLMAKKLLTGSVQWQLEQLRNLAGNSQVHVSMQRGGLQISKPGYIKNYQMLDDFVRHGLDLFDQFMLTHAVGIEFLHEDEASIVTDVKCPICSEEIKQDLVVCQRCKTPHCLDCWQYNGQCATYACSETRYVRAGSKSAVGS
jgi:hypothetical protein